jgi:hypothetical protein
LALLPDFLTRQQSELRENHEEQIHVKLMKAAQEAMIC